MVNCMITIQELFDFNQTIASDIFKDATYPWEVIPGIHDYILALGATLDLDRFERRGEDIWIAKSAIIDPTACLNGPLIIDEDAEIRHCAYIRGDVIVGKNVVVGNSTELKNSILFNGVQVPHYNYVGDSILGFKAHMGAGAVTSNVKSDYSSVTVKCADRAWETGLEKMGAILGDYAEIGCNSVLNPGTVIGRHTNVYPTSCVRGVVPENCIFKAQGNVVVKHKENV